MPEIAQCIEARYGDTYFGQIATGRVTQLTYSL